MFFNASFSSSLYSGIYFAGNLYTSSTINKGDFPPPSERYLIKNDGGYILQQNLGKILLNQGV